MHSKLTLRLDATLIQQAKTHAQRSGKSLSQMVADYFSRLERTTTGQDLPPITKSLKGAVPTTLDQADYRSHLEDKHR